MNCAFHVVTVVLYLAHYANLVAASPHPEEQWTYLYNANTSVASNLSSDVISQWSLSAKLIIQSYKSYKVMKLEDVQMRAYNGPINASPHLEDNPLPKEASFLTEPFLVNYNRNYEKLESVECIVNEPEWSMNIKKAIASVYQLDLSNLPENNALYVMKEEQNIYGKCKVKYENLSTNEATMLAKEINNNNCIIDNSYRNTWNNITLGYFEGRTVRHYAYNEKVTDGSTPLKSIKSKSTFLYRMLKSDRTIQEIQQTQQLSLLKTSAIINSIEVPKYTIKSPPTYKYDNNIRQEKSDPKETIMSKWMQQFQTIKNQINQNISTHMDEDKFNIINKLQNSLNAMDTKMLNDFKTKNYFDDKQMLNILASIIPYVGTKASVQFIKDMIVNNSVAHLTGLRLLSLFPLYVQKPTEEMLENMMEVLNNLKNITNETVKETYILSFSNLVYQMYLSKLAESNNIPETKIYYTNISKRYIEQYVELFKGSNNYTTRIKYILGMMNMGIAASDCLISIVQNTTESRHIRSLALYTITPEMLKDKHELYKTFWPIVKNAKEHFEIRAAALRLLLASDINSSQIYSILSYMNETSYDPAKQHLHNYFYTSVLSGKTDCEHCTLKKLAKSMLSDLNPPKTNQGLLTSYHQVSYTDDENNFETSLNVHVVANPVTNFANVFKLTLHHFTGRRQTGEFSVYVKAEGISSKLYKEEYERHYAIKELYKILQDMKLVLSEEHVENLHIEFILFYEKRAIFALHINNENIDEMADFIDEIIVYLGNNDIITMRDVRKMQFASDLGTPLFATLKYEHVLGTEFKNYDKIFQDEDDDNYVLTRIRTMWTSKLNFMSYNPLSNINHGVSKVYSNQNFIKFKINYNVYDLSIKWNDETSYFDTLIDYNYVVFVDNDENLKKYCKECKDVIFITDKNKTGKEFSLWLWAKNIIVKEANCSNPRYPNNALHEVIKKSRVSFTGLPFAQPFVLLAYIADYFYYIPQYEISSTSIIADRIVKEPNLATLKITFINDALDANYKLNLNFNITLALTQSVISSKKLINQWNLNLQRQELSKGVIYELHYDDNGRNIKFDANCELDYVPNSLNSDMFALKPAEPIRSRSSIFIKEKNSLPSTVQITSLFSVSDDQIKMVNASRSFELCQKDFESDYFRDLSAHSPPTKWCYNASLGLSTYDNYAIYIQFYNATDKVTNTLENEILKPLKNKNLPIENIIEDKTFNISMIYSALYSFLNIKVGETQIVSNYSVPELSRPWILLKPTSRFIEELRYNSFGLDNVCIILPRYVISFTGKLTEHDTDTSIIPLIECTNTTRLGLTTNRFTYKLWSDENTFQLGKKQGGYYVMRNGKYLKRNTRAEDYDVEFLNENTFHITTSRIDLHYNGEYLTIKIKSAFINRMCGVCTTNEFITPNMTNKYFN